MINRTYTKKDFYLQFRIKNKMWIHSFDNKKQEITPVLLSKTLIPLKVP